MPHSEILNHDNYAAIFSPRDIQLFTGYGVRLPAVTIWTLKVRTPLGWVELPSLGLRYAA